VNSRDIHSARKDPQKPQQLRLISHKLCPYVQRARIVLAEKRVSHDLEFIDLSAKPAWFLEVSPLGKVPVLLVDGEPLFESAVIAEYLNETTPGSLHPSDPFLKARNRSWIEFASSTLSAVATFYRAADSEALDSATQTLKERFARLEATLGGGPWFNGRAFSLVDAAFGPLFRYFVVFEQIGDFGFFDGTPRVSAWRRVLLDRPSIADAVVPDYEARLRRFLLDGRSALSRLMDERRTETG